MSVIVFKIAIAVLGSVVTVGWLRFRNRIDGISGRQQKSLLGLFFIVFRVAPFVLVYILLQQKTRSDVPVFFSAAVEAMHGKIVYRDFWTPYSPLFPYMTTLLLWFWKSAEALVFQMILMEGLALWLTWRVYRTEIGDSFMRLLTYLTLPGPLVLCVLGGQEDIWMWLFGVISIIVWQRTRDSLWIGVVMALALITTKALALLIIVPMFFLIDKPIRYVVGLAVTGLPALVLLIALVGDKFLTPLQFAEMPFAPNLWTVFSPLIGDFRPYSKILSWVGVGLTVAVSSLGAIILKQRMSYSRALPLLWTLCFCFMMFIHKSSFSNYAFIFLMPMMVSVIDLKNRWHIVALVLFNALIVIHPTYWWGLKTPIYTKWSHLASTANLIEYGMEVTFVGCLVYFLLILYRMIGRGHYRQADRSIKSVIYE
ncbi:hypothetical protein GCM10028803_53610 [Larkinella knui]|uniref:DUF2029 domain-containing protein n=1 Tax=Larkinella knui TaxID=2025310 RepID=A0A3P1CGE9_9BACT|nr:hypothetical protein [Larkinella knui]RRB12433.1 hypothetical protein EHT87_19740 [Larkinella knui]